VASKTQKRREQKNAKRKKRLTKERNLRTNGARFRFTLECRLTKEQPWKAMKRFRDVKEVNRHLESTEAIRKRGDTDIIEGRVIDNNNFGKVVATVESSMAECGPSLEEAARDISQAIKENPLNIAKEKFEKPLGSAGLDAISMQSETESQPEDANAEVSQVEP